ncbi:TetR/AcrR family transcriptional regulator [Variovorax sp. PAMC26660]|nr:TetR/AcrR family transcriptional regulator [Variovorax sp. PAMC26660]
MTKPAAAKCPSRAAPRPPAEGSTKPEGQWHHGDLRASLIAWGTHLLDTKGIAGMSMRAAARLAGVSQGAPAHHFKDRNGLLAAIAAQAFRDMVSLRMTRLDSVDANDGPARLRAVILGYVEFAQAHPARFHLMFSPQIVRRDQYPDLLQASGASFQLLRNAVALILPGARVGTLSEEELAFAVWAATHGLATLTVQGRKLPISATQRPTSSQLSEIVVQFCLAALRGPAAPD